MHRFLVASLLTALAVTTMCQTATAATSAPVAGGAVATHASRPEGVSWFEGDVAQAFVAAQQQHKPVFVYFGAVWCPPCQQLKATIFRRQDFLKELTLFIPVYLDGDAPGAQRWAEEFKVSGYPTVLILRADRSELGRVSSGMDLARYAEVLDLGLSATRPIGELLAATTAHSSQLTSEDCRRLAYNEWTLEPEWLDGEHHVRWLGQTSIALSRAARLCPPEDSIERARLSVIAVSAALEAESKSLKSGKAPGSELAAAIVRMQPVLDDDKLASGVADELEYLDSAFFAATVKVGARSSADLERIWFHLMDALATDSRYSAADRLNAVSGKITAAKALEPSGKTPAALATEARSRVAAALAVKSDPYTRTSIVNAALNVLDSLGDQDRSFEILVGEIKTSDTPYYYMSDLGDLEEQRGNKDAALKWYARGYQESVGPATRFQWGVMYVRALVRLHPDDEGAIRNATMEVLSELNGRGRIYGRSSAGLTRLAESLHTWNAHGQHGAIVQEIRAHLNDVCAQAGAVDAGAGACGRVVSSI